MQMEGNSIGKKSRSLLLDLVSLLGIVHRSLVLFIAILLLSESVAATPKPFSPLFKGGWGGSKRGENCLGVAATDSDTKTTAINRAKPRTPPPTPLLREEGSNTPVPPSLAPDGAGRLGFLVRSDTRSSNSDRDFFPIEFSSICITTSSPITAPISLASTLYRQCRDTLSLRD